MTFQPRPKKRLNQSEYGLGSIEQKNGRWWVRTRAKDGSRPRQGPFADRAAAVAHRDTGTVPLTGSAAQSVETYLYQWADNKFVQLRRGRSPHKSQAANVVKHVKVLGPQLDHIRLGDLNPVHLDRLWSDLAHNRRSDNDDRPYSEKYIDNMYSTLSQALDDAWRARLIVANPVPLSRRPEPHRGDVPEARVSPVLEPHDLRRILDWCRQELLTHRFALAVWLMLETGMRRGEALGVCYPDVSFEFKTVSIRHQIVKFVGEPPEFVPPKTGAGVRVVVLSDELLAAIQRLQASRTVIGIDQLLSCDPDGSPMNPNRMTNWFAGRLRKWLDLPEFATPHALRHTQATLLHRAGVPDAEIAARIGHEIDGNAGETKAPTSKALRTYLHGTARGGVDAAATWQQIMRDVG
ncbi:MAG TPA: site-specific integrase [Ilumatobacteraceae bacterium]|nr:site-specific integrase [Ilumatobacteraceae bacterium]